MLNLFNKLFRTKNQTSSWCLCIIYSLLTFICLQYYCFEMHVNYVTFVMYVFLYVNLEASHFKLDLVQGPSLAKSSNLCVPYLFQTCTQVCGIHKALLHVRRYNLIRQSYPNVDTCICTCKYIMYTETFLCELKVFPFLVHYESLKSIPFRRTLTSSESAKSLLLKCTHSLFSKKQTKKNPCFKDL